MAYAGTGDLVLFGMPVTALGTLTVAQQTAALDAASAELDAHLRARYTLPFVSYGIELTQKTVIIAKWQLLNVRGFNPNAGTDVAIRNAYLDAIQWALDAKNQLIHPDVVDSSTKMGARPLIGSRTPRGY